MSKPWAQMTRREKLLGMVEDQIAHLLWYDRKECETFARGDIERMLKTGEVTVDQMVAVYRKGLETARDR